MGKTTSHTTQIVPKHGRGRLNAGGTPGNKGGGRKPQEYIAFLRSTLDSQKHRDVIETKLTSDTRDFLHATELANSYVRGKPSQPINLNATVTVLWDL